MWEYLALEDFKIAVLCKHTFVQRGKDLGPFFGHKCRGSSPRPFKGRSEGVILDQTERGNALDVLAKNGLFTIKKNNFTRYQRDLTLPHLDRAILDLKLQRDKLRQYSKRIQTVLNREKELAKEALTQGDKSRALLILRRRKYQEQILLKADQQLETLEQLVLPCCEYELIRLDRLSSH